MRTGRAELPLHDGKAPRWLFQRMKRLARGILAVLIENYGPHEALRRLSDPFWFQAFGCVLGFDWHSSGLTTTTCGAVKEALRGAEKSIGLWAAGGKGAVSRKTPSEIEAHCDALGLDPAPLIYASRMSAKVDSAAVQDGCQIYHHAFFFVSDGSWAVVQQGMNAASRFARRYHWLSDSLKCFVNEPHAAICAEAPAVTLNMVASESEKARAACAASAREHPDRLLQELRRAVGRIRPAATRRAEEGGPVLWENRASGDALTAANAYAVQGGAPAIGAGCGAGDGRVLILPGRHDIRLSDIEGTRLRGILLKTYARQPEDFEKLLGTEGVGPKTIRALALISELVHGAPPSFRDPARFSFAHGGKDGTPFPV
ncbi:MAG: DUF763 domain-containing protein, partial [Planctomycetota bacterium]|nr:DUF763 domain-containing protein [Planctomycetota bacterium]